MEEMEMPTPCQNCDCIFDLNDGIGSEKWFPNTVICPACGNLERDEIKQDEETEEFAEQAINAMYDLKESYKQLEGRNALNLLPDEITNLFKQ
jgi:hypothetical protein